jgi:hypothetical protein
MTGCSSLPARSVTSWGGGVGLAGAASIIAALLRSGHSPRSAYDDTLLVFAIVSLAASLIVMVIRQLLVRRGLMKPLSMARDGIAGAAGDAAGAAAPAEHGAREAADQGADRRSR